MELFLYQLDKLQIFLGSYFVLNIWNDAMFVDVAFNASMEIWMNKVLNLG